MNSWIIKFHNKYTIIKRYPMRELITLIESLLEAPTPNIAELEAFKQLIASRIKELPDDDVTAKALREIEDLLKHVHAGGKMGIINGELQRINDPTVQAAQKILARYIMSLDMTPDQRDELFDLWRADKLINRKKLITPGKKDFSELVTNYNKNPVIKELVNELMRMATLGQGKGEFGLSVLSKNINKPEGKGDLLIDGKKIEAKTTDGGAGRFTDQEVRPGAGFEQAATNLNKFVLQMGVQLPKSGLSLSTAIKLLDSLSGNKKLLAQYLELVETVINLIFDSVIDVSKIMTAIKTGNSGAALQEYAKANFNYYMSKKDDEGVLYMNLTKEPISTVFFKDADDLAKSSLRLHASTPYITAIADVRLPYPQIEIVDTLGGATSPGDPAATGPISNPLKNPPAVSVPGKRIKIAPPTPAKFAGKGKISGPKGVGREKRQP